MDFPGSRRPKARARGVVGSFFVFLVSERAAAVGGPSQDNVEGQFKNFRPVRGAPETSMWFSNMPRQARPTPAAFLLYCTRYVNYTHKAPKRFVRVPRTFALLFCRDLCPKVQNELPVRKALKNIDETSLCR